MGDQQTTNKKERTATPPTEGEENNGGMIRGEKRKSLIPFPGGIKEMSERTAETKVKK